MPTEKTGTAILHLMAASLKISKAGQAQPSALSDAISKLVALAAFSMDDLSGATKIIEDFIHRIESDVSDEIAPHVAALKALIQKDVPSFSIFRKAEAQSPSPFKE